MPESTPPLRPVEQSGTPPQPNDPRFDRAKQLSSSALLLRAAIEGAQQALTDAKAEQERSAKQTKETYGQ